MFKTQCPSQDDLRDFMSGRLPDDQADTLAAHIDSCDSCCAALELASESSDDLIDLVRKSLQPASVAPSTNRVQSKQDTDPAVSHLSPTIESGSGTVHLNDRYTLHEEVGVGGIGRVYRGFDRELGREVAVKVLRPEHIGHPEMERRFGAEAKITGRLQHPGIVPVYGMDRDSQGRPFFAMKLIRGRTLEEAISSLPNAGSDGDLLRAFLRVCQAVAFAHGRGVIHRDLKPVNVMVGEFGEVQVMDWGLARDTVGDAPWNPSIGELSGDLAQSSDGTVIGTVSYMPPEQASGRSGDVGPGADVFSLGAILLHILTGTRLYAGDTTENILQKAVLCETGPALARLRERGPDEQLRGLVIDCLTRNPKARPDAASLVARLESYFQSVDDRLQQAEITAAEARAVATHERRVRRLTVTLSAVVAAGLTIGTGLWLYIQASERARQATNSEQVTESLAQAELILAHGLKRPLKESEFATVAARIERANEVIAAGPVNPESRGRAKAIAAVWETAEENHRLLHELDSLRHGPAIVDQQSNKVEWPGLRKKYQALYTQIGLGPDICSPAAAAQKIEDYPLYVREALITGIDLWRSGVRDAESDYWFSTTMAADPRRARSRIRELLHVGNASQLVDTFDPTAHSAATAFLIGNHFAARGHFVPAARVLAASAACHPGDYWINQSLTNALLLSDPHRRGEAVRYASAAVAINPDNLRALLGLAQSLLEVEDHPAALAACRRAISLDENYEPAHYVTAVIQYELGNYEAAETAILLAIRLTPQPRFRSVYAQILSRQLRWAEAMQQHTVALQAHPHRPEFLLSKAYSHMHRVEAERSAAHLEEAERCILLALESEETSRACTDHAILFQLRADLADEESLRRRHHEQAMVRLDRALALQPGFRDALVAMLRSAYSLNRTDIGDPIATGLLKSDRLTGYTLTRIAAYFRETHQNDRWRDTLRRAANSNTLSPKQQELVAGDLVVLKDHDAALGLLDRMLEADPVNALWHALRGQCLLNRSRLDFARAALEKATSLDDTRADTWELLAMTYEGLQLHVEAASVYARLAQLQPNSLMWRYNRGTALMQQKKYKQAIKAYQEALAINTTDLQTTINLAQAYQESGSFDEATALFQRALELDAEAQKWSTTVNRALNQLNRQVALSKRIADLRDGTLVPNTPTDRIAMARICQQTGEHDLALTLFRQVIHDPGSAEISAHGSLRYFAACSAVVSARSAAVEDANRAQELRNDALALISEELDLKTTQTEETEGTDRRFALYLRQWQTDPLLTSVRDADGLQQLEDRERRKWVSFWDGVQRKFDRHWTKGGSATQPKGAP